MAILPELPGLRSAGAPREKARRSLWKALSWRAVGTVDTFLLASLLTWGDIAAAGAIGAAEIVTKTALYFLHERVWARISFGARRGIVARGRRGRRLRRKASDTAIRSAYKTASWRVLASLDTMMLGWIFTGDIFIGLALGSLEVITKLLLYYVHERVWSRIRLGMT